MILVVFRNSKGRTNFNMNNTVYVISKNDLQVPSNVPKKRESWIFVSVDR